MRRCCEHAGALVYIRESGRCKRDCWCNAALCAAAMCCSRSRQRESMKYLHAQRIAGDGIRIAPGRADARCDLERSTSTRYRYTLFKVESKRYPSSGVHAVVWVSSLYDHHRQRFADLFMGLLRFRRVHLRVEIRGIRPLPPNFVFICRGKLMTRSKSRCRHARLFPGTFMYRMEM